MVLHTSRNLPHEFHTNKGKKQKANISFHNRPINARKSADKIPENFVRSRDAAAPPVNRDGGMVFMTLVVGAAEVPIV